MSHVDAEKLARMLEGTQMGRKKESGKPTHSYGCRARFVPTCEEDFDDGGAYPECHVVQFPRGMGRHSKDVTIAEACLKSGMSVEQLMQRASARMLQTKDTTPEYDSFVSFMSRNESNPAAGVPGTRHDTVRRIRNVDSYAVEKEHLEGKGQPAVIEDACRDWKAIGYWQFATLKERFPATCVVANDRAPARHRDKTGAPARPQRTAQVTLETYMNYTMSRTGSDLETEAAVHGVPFYLNGWKAFVDFPELLEECPYPYFTSRCDQTLELMKELDRALFGKVPLQAAKSTEWYKKASLSMSKVFAGPRGTITRLHFDSGDAHGWLAQVHGRKLFVLYSPEDSKYLYEIPGEEETTQSFIDPLNPDFQRFPLYQHARPLAVVLEEGQAILIPKGWWHYAVSLDPSITVMRNFYNARTNTKGLVEFMLRSLSKDMPKGGNLSKLNQR